MSEIYFCGTYMYIQNLKKKQKNVQVLASIQSTCTSVQTALPPTVALSILVQ